MFQVPAPPRRICPLAMPGCAAPIEHGLDAAAYPARGLRRARPDRAQAFQHQRRVDRRDRQLAEQREDMLAQTRWPFRRVLGIAPARCMRADVAVGSLLEGDRLGARLCLGGALLIALRDGINACEASLAALQGVLARLRQRDRVQRAETHPPVAIFADLVAKQPRSVDAAVLGLRDLQIEPAAVGVEPALGAPNRAAGEPMNASAMVHIQPPYLPFQVGY